MIRRPLPREGARERTTIRALHDPTHREEPVRLLRVHRILIVSGIVLCGLYTLRHMIRYATAQNGGDLVRTLCALLVAVVLSLYLRSIRSY